MTPDSVPVRLVLPSSLRYPTTDVTGMMGLKQIVVANEQWLVEGVATPQWIADGS